MEALKHHRSRYCFNRNTSYIFFIIFVLSHVDLTLFLENIGILQISDYQIYFGVLVVISYLRAQVGRIKALILFKVDITNKKAVKFKLKEESWL